MSMFTIPPLKGEPPLIQWVYVAADGKLYGSAFEIRDDPDWVLVGEMIGRQITSTLEALAPVAADLATCGIPTWKFREMAGLPADGEA